MARKQCWGFVVYFLIDCCLVLVDGRVQQISACKAKVDNRLINLEPLQRLDGQPRLKAEFNGTLYYYNPCVSFNMPYKDPHAGGGDHCYFVAMCVSKEVQQPPNNIESNNYYTLGIQSTVRFLSKPYNSLKFPTQVQTIFKKAYPGFAKYLNLKTSDELENNDKHIEGSENKKDTQNSIEQINKGGEETSSEGETEDINVVKGYNKTINNNKSENHSSEKHQTSKSNEAVGGISSFSSSEEMLLKITYLSLKGIRSNKNSKTYIYLLCDHTKQKPDEAKFKFVDVPETLDKHFILQHQCSCPDGCPRYGSYDYSDGEYSKQGNDTEGAGDLTQTNLPKYMWLVVVINGAIFTVAVVIGGIFCRSGASGNGAYYNMLPAIHSSKLTLSNSTDSLFQGRSKLKRPEYLEYSSALTKAAQLPSVSDGLIERRDLEIGQRLGGGLYGDTYLAEWKDRKVAAKRVTVNIHQNQMTEEDHQWICKELVYLSKQKHKNLIVVFGMCTYTKQPYIVTEFFEGEVLKEIIKRQIEGFTWPKKIKLCLQVADGIAFLHSAKYPILHRDLRCANILVDQSERIKIVDFGLTKIMQRLRQKCTGRKGCFCNKDMCAVPGSVRWTAPEVLAYPIADEYNHFDILTRACDTYSYAMLLWEVSTSMDPFEDIPDDNEVIEIVISGGRPPLDTVIGVPTYVQDLMKKCWSHDPDNRPNFKNIAVQMKTLLANAYKDKRTRTTSSTNQYMKSLLSTHLEA